MHSLQINFYWKTFVEHWSGAGGVPQFWHCYTQYLLQVFIHVWYNGFDYDDDPKLRGSEAVVTLVFECPRDLYRFDYGKNT